MKRIYLLLFSLFFSLSSFGISVITGASYVCVGSTTTLTDSTSGGTWVSSAPAIAGIGISTGFVSGISAGTATITYFVGTSYVTCHLTVDPHVAPTVHIITSTSDTVCAGTLVTFTASIANGGSDPIYQWTLNDSDAGIVDTLGYNANPGDTIGVFITSDAACASPDSAYASIALNVLPALIPYVNINASPGFFIGLGEYDTLSADVTGVGTSFTCQWIINSTPVPGVTSVTYVTDSLADNDSVTCVVTSVGPCGGYSNFNSVPISVGPSGVHSPTGEAAISCFPNPNNGNFTLNADITGAGAGTVIIEITNLTGSIEYRANAQLIAGKMRVPITLNAALPSGIYLLRLSSDFVNKVIPVTISR